jgi:RecA/RadA recombinase
MADKKNLRKPDEDFNLDRIIEEESAKLGLTPTNLERGTLVEDSISTGTLSLDLVTGGGWPKGRRSNVFGKEQVGKSTLLYYAIKACIDQGIPSIMYDFEGATDGDRVERIGVKINWLKELEAKEPVLFRYYDKMTCGEQMFRHARRILDRMPEAPKGKVQLAFFHDSLPATPSEQKLQDDEKDPTAVMARMYSQWLPTIKSAVAAKSAIWIDTNQLRTNPRTSGYGNPEYEMCGDAVKTMSDVRVKAKKTIPTLHRGKPENKTYIEVEDCWDGIGSDKYNFANLYVVKNKAFSPNRGCTLRIWFEEAGQPGRGIDPLYDVYEYLRLTGQIHYNRRKFTILLDPFDKLRDVRLPDLDDSGNHKRDVNGVPLFKMVPETDEKGKEKIDLKTGVVSMRYDTEKKSDWTWAELKDLVLNPTNTKGKERKPWDIIATCRKQIRDGSAFKLYFDNLVNTQVEESE